MEVEEERRRREGERGGLNLFYVWTYCAIYQWPDLSNVCLDRSVQYNIGHIWPIGQISPMEAINYNFPQVYYVTYYSLMLLIRVVGHGYT